MLEATGLLAIAVLIIVIYIARYWHHIPWSARYLRYIAVLVHVPAALITIGLFMIHIYMSVFAERGAFGSVIRGDVSVDFARRYHPGWYEEVVRSSTVRSSPAPPARR